MAGIKSVRTTGGRPPAGAFHSYLRLAMSSPHVILRAPVFFPTKNGHIIQYPSSFIMSQENSSKYSTRAATPRNEVAAHT